MVPSSLEYTPMVRMSSTDRNVGDTEEMMLYQIRQKGLRSKDGGSEREKRASGELKRRKDVTQARPLRHPLGPLIMVGAFSTGMFSSVPRQKALTGMTALTRKEQSLCSEK